MPKRKRPSHRHIVAKRPKLITSTAGRGAHAQVVQPLLAHCYRQVQTLKDYLLAVLPASSRVRRKRLTSLTETIEYAQFFTTTLVGVRGCASPAAVEQRSEGLALFTQTCRGDCKPSATGQQWSIDDVSYHSAYGKILTIETGSRLRHLDSFQRMHHCYEKT